MQVEGIAADRRRGLLPQGVINVGQHDPGTRCGQLLGLSAADPLRSPGHDYGLAFCANHPLFLL